MKVKEESVKQKKTKKTSKKGSVEETYKELQSP